MSFPTYLLYYGFNILYNDHDLSPTSIKASSCGQVIQVGAWRAVEFLGQFLNKFPTTYDMFYYIKTKDLSISKNNTFTNKK